MTCPRDLQSLSGQQESGLPLHFTGMAAHQTYSAAQGDPPPEVEQLPSSPERAARL